VKILERSKKAYLGVTALVAMGLALSAPTMATAVQTPPVTIQATNANVNLSCQAGGGWAFSVSLNDAAPNTTYPVEFRATTSSGSFSGGSFDNMSLGNIVTGSFGLGTSNTFTHVGDGSTDTVSIVAFVAGQTARATDTC
jgi:hypothetical protein